MLKKKMTYKDFNGVERTEVFCFHISEAELMQMELETEGGYRGLLRQIVDAKDQTRMIKLFKDFIDLSYGVLSPDGKYFSKSAEELAKFKATQAYSDLYMSLLNEDEASKFLMAAAPNIPLTEESADVVEKELGVTIPRNKIVDGATVNDVLPNVSSEQ